METRKIEVEIPPVNDSRQCSVLCPLFHSCDVAIKPRTWRNCERIGEMLTHEKLNTIEARGKDDEVPSNILGLDSHALLAHIREQEEQIKSLEYIILLLKAEIYDITRSNGGGENAIHNA